MNIASIFQPKSAAAKAANPEFKRIDTDFGTVIDGYEKVQQDLQAIGQENTLKPPSLSNFNDAQLLAIGVTAGGTVGGSVGLASNLLTSWGAQPKVDITTVTHNVMRPVLVGNTESRDEVFKNVTKYDQNGRPYQGAQLTGWKVNHLPSFRNEKAGEYTTQSYKVSDAGMSNPLGDALGGMAIGAGVGTLLAAGTVLTRKLTGTGTYEPSPTRQTQGDMKVLLQMSGMGAAAGGVLGGISGLLASGSAVTKTVVNQVPNFGIKVLGQMPADFTQSVYQSKVSVPGTQDVSAKVPVMEGGVLGVGQHVKVTENKEVIHAGGGLNLATGVLSGAVAGAGIGAAAAVLTNILRKTL